MTPYYDDGVVALYHGDSADVLVMKTHRHWERGWRSSAVHTVSRIARYVACMRRMGLEPRIVGLWTY